MVQSALRMKNYIASQMDLRGLPIAKRTDPLRTFCIGMGDRFDAEKLVAYPPGAVIILPGDTFHFHWARAWRVHHASIGHWAARP